MNKDFFKKGKSPQQFFEVADPPPTKKGKIDLKPFPTNDVNQNVKNEIEIDSINKPSPKILVAITSFNSPQYVDLSLSLLAKWRNDFDIIVIDDHSENPKYLEVCKRHDVTFITTDRRHSHGRGDVAQIIIAMEYANGLGYDYLVKQSQRWICLENPAVSLKNLIELSGGFAFSNETKSFGFKFRTEFFCIKVKEWMRHLDLLRKMRDSNTEPQVEYTFEILSRKTQPTSKAYLDYQKNHNARFGYVAWDWMGNDRLRPPPYILWHDRHSPKDYKMASDSLELNITGF